MKYSSIENDWSTCQSCQRRLTELQSCGLVLDQTFCEPGLEQIGPQSSLPCQWLLFSPCKRPAKYSAPEDIVPFSIKAPAVELLVKPLELNSCGQRQAEPIFRILWGAGYMTNPFLLLEMPGFVNLRTVYSIQALQTGQNLGLFMNTLGRIIHLKADFSSSTHLFLS